MRHLVAVFVLAASLLVPAPASSEAAAVPETGGPASLRSASSIIRDRALSPGGAWAAYQVVDEAFVGTMIDANALSEPERAARFPDPLHAHVDVYWSDRFAEVGQPYRPPTGVVGFATVIETGCGLADPDRETAFYCVLDETIYYSIEFREIIETSIGDYGWVVVVAHEWAHHAQRLVGSDLAMLPYQPGDGTSIALEQQADCLAGAYTEAAELSGWLDPGDVGEAITMTELSGDPPGTAVQHPTAHGSGAERVGAFSQGYELGIAGCGLGL